jgi:hypothetical protein
MTLLYFSPVPWNSFSQRPHHFVNWYQARFGGRVFWVDPYPSRLPKLLDVKRLFERQRSWQSPAPSWLSVVQPKLLPIEPLQWLAWLNRLLWSKQHASLIHVLNADKRQDDLFIAIGKPSGIALHSIKAMKPQYCLWDAMDDFSEFHQGLANKRLLTLVDSLLGHVDAVWATSSKLFQKYSPMHRSVFKVPNAVDCKSFENLALISNDYISEKNIAGYIGTIGDWFDWDWVVNFAKMVPHFLIELTGPVFTRVPHGLPKNVTIKTALPHFEAMAQMRRFKLALIPFKKTRLTDAVDPIKYYEYKGVGLPILCTDFGEMSTHKHQPGVFVCDDELSMRSAIECAMIYRATDHATAEFIKVNEWQYRFDQAYGQSVSL